MTDELKRDRLIKDMSEDERPREKALKHGLSVLTDAELMAIVFATGVRGKSVVSLCQEIIDDYGGIDRVATVTPQALASNYKGVGEVKAITLLAALTLGERCQEAARTRKNEVVNESRVAYELMRYRFERLQHEEFWILLIDRAGHPIRSVRISQGGTAATTVDVKLIMKAAIESLASSIILFHNHPSGSLRPSIEDDKLTKKIAEAAKLMDIRVNDHLIITNTSYYSYADNGRM